MDSLDLNLPPIHDGAEELEGHVIDLDYDVLCRQLAVGPAGTTMPRRCVTEVAIAGRRKEERGEARRLGALLLILWLAALCLILAAAVFTWTDCSVLLQLRRSGYCLRRSLLH